MPRIPNISPFHFQPERFHRPGWLQGGVISDNGNQTVTVTKGAGYIRIADNVYADLKFITWDADSSIAIGTNTTVYIGVEYNNGSPRIFSTTDASDFTGTTNFFLGTIVNVSDILYLGKQIDSIHDKQSFVYVTNATNATSTVTNKVYEQDTIPANKT